MRTTLQHVRALHLELHEEHGAALLLGLGYPLAARVQHEGHHDVVGDVQGVHARVDGRREHALDVRRQEPCGEKGEERKFILNAACTRSMMNI